MPKGAWEDGKLVLNLLPVIQQQQPRQQNELNAHVFRRPYGTGDKAVNATSAKLSLHGTDTIVGGDRKSKV